MKENRLIDEKKPVDLYQIQSFCRLFAHFVLEDLAGGVHGKLSVKVM